MTQNDLINPFDIKQFLLDAFQERSPATGNFTDKENWQVLELNIAHLFEDSIAFSSPENCNELKIEQPLSICMHQGSHKYIFNTTVQNIQQQGCTWRILVDMPDKAERIQRRMYNRQPVPDSINVVVTFWKRGCLNNDSKETHKHECWQGKLLNLSAGGTQFETNDEFETPLQIGQALGIHFTPMCYQKPLLLESHIKYLNENADTGSIQVGVEFLGLGSSLDGKEKLARILEVIDQYKKLCAPIRPVDAEEIHV